MIESRIALSEVVFHHITLTELVSMTAWPGPVTVWGVTR